MKFSSELVGVVAKCFRCLLYHLAVGIAFGFPRLLRTSVELLELAGSHVQQHPVTQARFLANR